MASNMADKDASSPKKCFPVRKIIGAHIDERNNTFYQVQWEPTWEPAENLMGCENLVNEFWMRFHPIALEHRIKQESDLDQDFYHTRSISNVVKNTPTKQSPLLLNAIDKLSNPARPPYLHRRGCRLGVVGSNLHPHHQRKHNVSVRNCINKDDSATEPSGPMPGYLTRRKPTANLAMAEISTLSSNVPSQTFKLRPLEDEDDVCGDDLSTSTTIFASSSSYMPPSCSYSAGGGSTRSETESMVSGNERESLLDRLKPRQEETEMELSEVEGKLCESSQNLLTPFACHICSFRSSEKSSLQRHFQNKHSLTKRDVNIVFPCQLCNKLFKKKSYLFTHLASHPKLCVKPYLCSICKTSFSHIVQLERHHLSHEYDLTKDPNEVTVDDQEPKKEKTELFHCARCSLGFESMELLQKHKRRHIETILTSTSFSPLKNEALSFKSSDKLITTAAAVTTESVQENLKRKIKNDAGKDQQPRRSRKRGDILDCKKVLDCPYCPSKFSNNNYMGITNLNIHLVIKHKDTLNASPHTDLHKCPRCVKLFSSTQSLGVHILKKHGANNNCTKKTKKKGEVVLLTVGESISNHSPDKKKPIPARKKKGEVALVTVGESSINVDSLDKKKSIPGRKKKYSIRREKGASSGSEKLSVKQTQERKSRFRKRLLKKRTQLKKQPLSTSNRTVEAVAKSNDKLEAAISSSGDLDLATLVGATSRASVYNIKKRGRGRPPNNASTSSKSSIYKRTGRGRPPGIGKVISGRIVKKYKCKYCHLNYIHFPSFSTHQKLCAASSSKSQIEEMLSQ